MKYINIFFLLFSISIVNAQSLPIDFETAITTSNFIDFDGGTATVIPNPQPNGINTSTNVAQIVRDGGTIWSGSKIELANNLDFTTLNGLSMKVFTTAPIGTIVKFKLEGAGAPTERDMPTTVTNEWETLTWDFTGTPTELNTVVFMFDFGNVGDGSVNSTFLFDDVEQLFGGEQIDLPVDFESSTINYTMTDFGGNVSSLVADPMDATNNVIQAIKTDQAATWAGTTIGTPGGFATDIPLTLDNSIMTAKVWSPDAGIPVRLKVEDSNDPTHTCETQTNTTVAGDWEIMEFDFATEAPGTAALSFGLDNGWKYNKASIFFNFDTEGAVAGEKTYYFDNVAFGDFVLRADDLVINDISIFPNPTRDQWTISAEDTNITLIEIFDIQGKLMFSQNPNNTFTTINAATFANGIYITKVSTPQNVRTFRLVKN